MRPDRASAGTAGTRSDRSTPALRRLGDELSLVESSRLYDLRARLSIDSGDAAPSAPEPYPPRSDTGPGAGGSRRGADCAARSGADLSASGELSRRLASRSYFRLIRSLTDLIDAEVAEHGGIIGGVEPDALAYRTVAELVEGGKAARDAGSIAVAEL